ncbi:1865_t:CDS:10 [Paraglomus occultum]|uniref:1865_t:CDS:1 n=1 Tax=Paraglomus occultum TaxID=144539 RepID=A0A9N9GAX9_9GLOM|nr:1865_t:CDS:10 [Paraglomus occultum]
MEYRGIRRKNILFALFDREVKQRRIGPHNSTDRGFYKYCYPNQSIFDVCLPDIWIRRFTPDGKYLICFTKCLKGFQLYYFKETILEKETEAYNEVNCTNAYPYPDIKFLSLDESASLFKDFCLVTTNAKYVSIEMVNLLNPVLLINMLSQMILATANSDRENEPVVENRPGKLKYNLNTENYHFYVIEIETGVIKDKIVYENDRIYANHHNGVSMMGNLFAVLSVQYQTIYINVLRDDGRIIKLRNVGYYAFEDDELTIAKHEKMEEKFQANRNNAIKKVFGRPCENNIEAKTNEDNAPCIQSTSPSGFYLSACNNNRDDQVVPTIELGQTQKQQRNVNRSRGFLVPSTEDATPLIGGIKHRVLSYLYRLAFNKTDRSICVEHFYRTFPQLELLTMWRMQFIDESHFLIKFACPDCVIGRHSETVGHPCLFAVYNYQTTEVVAVYDNASKEFLDIFKDYCDHLRFVAFNQPFHYDANCSNNLYAREYWNKYKHSLKQRLGGEIPARRRLLSVLPYGPQTYSETPFFDISLFAYDEKFHLSSSNDLTARFFSQHTRERRFTLSFGSPEAHDLKARRCLNIIAHPSYPFIISIQYTLMRPSVVNFHVRAS